MDKKCDTEFRENCRVLANDIIDFHSEWKKSLIVPKNWESGSSSDWFPISDEYKMFYKENRAYFSFTIPAAVAIELLFGLNDTK